MVHPADLFTCILLPEVHVAVQATGWQLHTISLTPVAVNTILPFLHSCSFTNAPTSLYVQLVLLTLRYALLRIAAWTATCHFAD